ncbi:hypothetical protein C8J57DRAFT_1167972 [Mycena rebaudengoi]|nr:hypothetical protein C8J57DRAFT_1167972 [Mycena rebaudengoi]
MSRYTASSGKASASPSVALEKGRYRIRAPSDLRPIDAPYLKPQPRVQNVGSISSYMAALITLLALACLSSFGFAYYLFTTRWDPTELHRLNLADENTKVIPYNTLPHQHYSSEKFLSYLPHSGLHNQRIAFENAIVLGILTNRTVLVPPIRLGSKPLRYTTFDSLQQVLALAGKTGLQHCSHIHATQFLAPECFDYFDYTHISPAWLFNLTNIAPLTFLEDLSGESIRRHLQIPVSEILTLRDTAPYHYRFLDTFADTSPLTDKYTECIYIPELARHPHRLLQIGTLFGSSRLRLKDRNNRLIRTQVRQSMEFSSPQLVDAADAIERSLGGHYLAAHVRIGDGVFRINAERNLRQVWWQLVHEFLQFNISETLEYEQSFQVLSSTDENEASVSVANGSLHRLPPFHLSSLKLPCRRQRHSSRHMNRLNSPLFVSTDIKDAASDPYFSVLLRTFPCTFFLSDFPMHTHGLNSFNGYDRINLMPFLLPLLDAMVVGRASRVAGTEGSTFTRFIQDVLWRRHHGLEIIERG